MKENRHKERIASLDDSQSGLETFAQNYPDDEKIRANMFRRIGYIQEQTTLGEFE